MKNFRAPAVPLIANDPMFSLWSTADRLTDDTTRHWTGVRQFIAGVLYLDGYLYEFLGTVNPVNDRYYGGYDKLPQVDVQIRPMTTEYTFQNEKIRLRLTFTSPLLLDDLDVLSWPVTYLHYRLESVDGCEHDCRVYFGFSGEFCVDNPGQSVAFGKDEHSAWFTSGVENMLLRHGDDHRIEWGSFHIIAPGHDVNAMSLRWFQRKIRLGNLDWLNPRSRILYQGPNMENWGPETLDPGKHYRVGECWPVIETDESFTVGAAAWENTLILAYDDVKSIQYFGENLEAYWRKDGRTFPQLMDEVQKRYPEIMEKVRLFEEDLLTRAEKKGEKYAQLLALAYRQSVAGHKLCHKDSKPLFFSKENYSNGCIATVDVTYPSIPLFLMYAPCLVEGMLEPVFELVNKGLWPYEFAPHDVGRYPLANKQIYGFDERYLKLRPDPIDSQMPVEECGNMLLCVAAICRAEGTYDYFLRHEALLTQWADYLVKTGWDPDNQLCTDDFAGHLAHNCNLSVKAICALGAYAQILQALGREEWSAYRQTAERFAAAWEENAHDGDHYKLAFDQPGTWSVKYNMVWDKRLSLGLFSRKVYDRELAWYCKQLRPYGLPLDSRADYTKSDWQLWAAVMLEDEGFFQSVVERMYAFVTETPDRIPFTDLYFTSKPYARGFQARTVQGGLFMALL